MIQFPPEYVQLTLYPGYYWNTRDHQLYSIKSGLLRPLKRSRAWRGWVNGVFKSVEEGYSVSIFGRRQYITYRYLRSLSRPHQLQLFPEDNV